MRLFYAVTFDGDVKNKLCDVIDGIRPYCKSGRFTASENLHLTLVFLGETPFNRVALAREAADSADMEQFSVMLGGIGRFKHKGGDILWIGAKPQQNLIKIYDSLCASLKADGFKIESRAYSPHVTLARQAVLSAGTQNGLLCHGAEIELPVRKISLMKSERVNGKLTYTEIYAKPLKKEC